MPIIKSAIKKVRKDKKRTKHNLEIEEKLKKLLKAARKNPSKDSLSKLSSALDRAVKINLIHLNKSSRLKSRLSKLIASGSKTSPTSKKAPKKAAKKSPAKKKA